MVHNGDDGETVHVGILVNISGQIINGVDSRIHHPFLLSDNRHYTFYVWRRVYMVHPIMPYALVPVYLACAWAWWLRVGMWQPYKGKNEHELIWGRM